MFQLNIDEVIEKQWLKDHPSAKLIAETNGKLLQLESSATLNKFLSYLLGLVLTTFLAVIIVFFGIIAGQVRRDPSTAFPILFVVWFVLLPPTVIVASKWIIPWTDARSSVTIRYYLYHRSIFQLMLTGSTLRWFFYTTEITADQANTIQVREQPRKRPKANRALVVDRDPGDLELLFGYGTLGGEEIKRVYDLLKEEIVCI